MTGVNTRDGWPEGMRLRVRRDKPSRRQMKKLTNFEEKTGWRYAITATNIRLMWGIADSHQIQFLDALHCDHAEVEDRIRTGKALRACTTCPHLHGRSTQAGCSPRTWRPLSTPGSVC
ncbi:hypothetical protein [Streptomyces fuscichromogenes]|uniref:Uncharacterized protein n=1 Tax=Streptomyces fuscichromogenes TaxID=1324013 RepID=A0A918CX65_9ACTN|nr:hypothetical protein [Streptomyces fuscichromogenes]GGN43850.1 hypothetical protein GCM10011578_094320 [Streptomyces fuscichromogenes]